MKHLIKAILLVTLIVVGSAPGLAQGSGSAASTTDDRQARKQAERERKEAERRRKEEEKEAQRIAGVRCNRLQRKR